MCPPCSGSAARAPRSAAAGFAAAPGFWLVLGVAFLFGVAAGLMDGGLNTAIGLSGRPRLLNLLHGAYGVGTAIGPLLVIGAILAGSWRAAYFALVGVDLVGALLWLLLRRRMLVGAAAGVPDAELSSSRQPRRGRRGAILAGMVVFFIYTGLEVSAGQWETTFNRGHLHLSAVSAGVGTFGYWGALTGVRITLALLPRPIANRTVVSGGSALAVIAAAVVWWQPDTAVTLIGFVMLGAALAGVFPALIALTPARIGDQLAHDVIAWQVGAAAAGGAGLSALVGLLIGATSLGVVGPSITALAVALIVAELVLGRLAPIQ